MYKLFKVVAIAAMLIVTAVLFGCGIEDSMPPNLPPDFTISSSTQSAQSNQMMVDVYFDATESMRGYTTLPKDNVYITLPNVLNDLGSLNGEIKFFSFGEIVKPLLQNAHRKFSSPAPYTEKITAIHNVIDKADSTHLSIIITDLFESESDWSNISKKIRSKYFAHNLSVAVIGIKNPFNGKIFDVGLNAAKYNYNSGNNSEKYRPFYMILLGSENHVVDFMQRFKSSRKFDNKTEYLLLTEHLNANPNDFSINDMHIENLFVDRKFGFEDQGVFEFGLDSFNSEASIAFEFKYHANIGTSLPDVYKTNTNVKILSTDCSPDSDWQERSKNNVTVEIIPAEGVKNAFDVKFKFTPSETLDNKKVTLIQIVELITSDGYSLPNWVNDWNMENIESNPSKFDGSKTVNLTYILGSLKESLFAASSPELLKLNLSVDTR